MRTHAGKLRRMIGHAAVLAGTWLAVAGGAWAAESDKPIAADPNEDFNAPPAETAAPEPTPAARQPATGSPVRPAGNAPAATPTAIGGDFTPKELTENEKRKRLFDFLEREYGKQLANRDWITRSIATISMSRVPGRTASDAVLKVMVNDKSDIVRLVAWQALLSRVKYLHLEHYEDWVAATWPMVEKGMFRGSLRVGLLRLMATVPPSDKAKAAFMKIFAETNSLDAEDIPTLDEMGKCLAAWKSPAVVEQLLAKLGTLDDAYRAEYVLQKAGAGVPWARERMNQGSAEMWKLAQADYAKWWTENKASWVELKQSEVEQWRALPPQFVEPPPAPDAIDITDPRWKKDLELGGLGLGAFDVCLAVDATGSMGEVLAWLKRDVRKMMLAFSLISREPRIGLVFYRDHGDRFVTKAVPLTDQVDTLIKELGDMKAEGGEDIPEAIYDALAEAYGKNPWVGGTQSRKILVLIGDAPPKPETTDKTQSLVKEKADQGFRLYAVKVTTEYGANDLSTFDALATAGNGVAIPVDFPGGKNAGFPGLGELVLKGKPTDRKAADMVVLATAREGLSPSEKVLLEVLIGAINPQYRDRLEPFVKTVIAFCQLPIPEKRRAFGPEDKPEKPKPVDPKYRPGDPAPYTPKNTPKPAPTPKRFNPQDR